MSLIGILGAGCFAREAYAWAYRSRRFAQHFLVASPEYRTTVYTYDGASFEATAEAKDLEYICGISDANIKKMFFNLNIKLAQAVIDPSATNVGDLLGAGSIVCPGAVVSVNTNIGIMATINLNATIGHDCKIGDFFNIAPNASLSGSCTVGTSVSIGSGAVVREKLNICDNVTIGMGGVVVKDIVEPGVYAGVPVKKIK